MQMSRWTKYATSVVVLSGCLLLFTTPVAAQATATANINATATVVGLTPLAATGVNDLDFGAVVAGFPASPDVANLASQAGRFDVTGEPAAPVSVDFTLPVELTGIGAAVIPISFAATDGLEWTTFPTAYSTFDPNFPHFTAIDAAGNLTIGITGTINPAAAVISGAYSGTVVLTVAYF